ncbi:hypothetical protein SAMN06297229_1539 [Pseudidiomarina planktonica]|uniref:DUF4377 domain-containing protein n=1 Tax=Pseudidiomarina planktonica TaxID=1323738 RepID=A0A1Y6EVA5_9GAMM|nr:hypothetical protein [Pseudidiomarina planktonica]RUO65101.1 hypothetical protein CWI77_01080 [Pseudidiomarina planktonica]SMQ66487.1 hypothetical protein SAMN06297229_1539 [Pseudidiomarina planktonica]
MRFTTFVRSVLLALSACYLLGCNDSSPEPVQPQEYTISAPSNPVYYGPGVALSPLIGVPAQLDNGQIIFVDDVFDFEYQFGTSYELRLVTFQTSDGTTYFKLVEVISAEPDAIGTSYIYSDVELTRGSFTEKSSGVFGFFGYSFLCAQNLDCASLVAISQSGGLVEVEFDYTGGAVPITLVRWN